MPSAPPPQLQGPIKGLWMGSRKGIQGPTRIPENAPHDALVIWRSVSCVKRVLSKHLRFGLSLSPSVPLPAHPSFPLVAGPMCRVVREAIVHPPGRPVSLETGQHIQIQIRSLGRLCQRSPRTVPVSLLRVGSARRRASAFAIRLVHPRVRPHTGGGA